MAKLLVQLTGLFFIGYGIAFAIYPAEMATIITGASPSTASGLMDLRSTYGGMTAAVGIVLIMLTAKKEGLSFALKAISIILLAMATARVLGMCIDGTPNNFMIGYLVAEVMGAAIALGFRKSIQTSE